MMGAPIAILIILLIVLAATMRIWGMILLMGFVLLIAWLLIGLLVQFFGWLMGGGQGQVGGAARGDDSTSTDDAATGKVCPDPQCGRINPARARFCGQCGRPLGSTRRGEQG